MSYIQKCFYYAPWSPNAPQGLILYKRHLSFHKHQLKRQDICFHPSPFLHSKTIQKYEYQNLRLSQVFSINLNSVSTPYPHNILQYLLLISKWFHFNLFCSYLSIFPFDFIRIGSSDWRAQVDIDCSSMVWSIIWGSYEHILKQFSNG